MGSLLRGTLQRQRADLGLVQPPYAENRTYGGVEGTQGEIPASPSDQKGEMEGHAEPVCLWQIVADL